MLFCLSFGTDITAQNESKSLVLKYDFSKASGNTIKDLSNNHADAKLMNGAKVENGALRLYAKDAYLDMTAKAGQAMSKLTDFSIFARYKIDSKTEIKGYGHFLWCFSCKEANSEKEGPYQAYRVNEQRCETSIGGWSQETGIQKGQVSESGKWVTVFFRQQSGKGELYIDGKLIGIDSNFPNPKDIFKQAPKFNWMGRAPFNGDEYLKNTSVSDFRVYNQYLHDEEVKKYTSINIQKEASNIKETTVYKDANVEFHQIDENTWHGNGTLCYNESVYLIAGEEEAILIDAGVKMPGLKAIAEKICKKPVRLVISHAHGDHIGAIEEWDTLWMNAADEAIFPVNRPSKVKRIYMQDGMIFNLGGREIEVVFTPGHTPGSTTFIDRKNHYGFSSDAFGSGNLLVFTDLSTEAASCRRMKRFIEKYHIKYFYPGHYWGDNLEMPQRVSDISELCEDILNGKKEGATGEASGWQYVLKERGVRINYRDAQKR